MKNIFFILAIAALFFAGCSESSKILDEYDVVINNGRVMDPETNFDGIRNVGIKDGIIVSITEKELNGKRTIDATGHVVSPGWIDQHMHAADPFIYKALARDGVTSVMDTEYGSLQIAKFYEAREGTAILNYGQCVSHEYARMAVLDGVIADEGTFVYRWRAEAAKDGVSSWATELPTEEQLEEILAWMEKGLEEGAIGVCSTVGYFKAACTSKELYDVMKLGKKWDRLAGVHTRFGPHDAPPNEFPLGFKEALANAAALDMSLICSHINFAGWNETHEIITSLREQGYNFWGEQYPWVAGGPSAGALITSPENLKSWGFEIKDVVLDPSTGKYLTEEEYRTMRNEDPGKALVVFTRPKEWPAQLVATKDLAIVSDGLSWFDGEYGFESMTYPGATGVTGYDYPYEKWKGHPRAVGSRGKAFRLAREHDIPLMQVISNASYFIAKHMGRAGVEFFDKRGRMQEGMVADITVFNPETITETCDYLPGKNGLPTTGVPYVLVNGSVVVDDSKVNTKQFPGLPIRYEPK